MCIYAQIMYSAHKVIYSLLFVKPTDTAESVEVDVLNAELQWRLEPNTRTLKVTVNLCLIRFLTFLI